MGLRTMTEEALKKGTLRQRVPARRDLPFRPDVMIRVPALRTGLCLALACAVLSGEGQGKENLGRTVRDVDEQIAELLEKLPAENTAEQTELKQALSELGPAGIERLCAMLVAPGTGDDTKARMALHALAILAGGQGESSPSLASPPRGGIDRMQDTPPLATLGSGAWMKTRGEFVEAVCKALKDNPAPAAGAFLVGQLQLAGGEEAAGSLAELLHNKELCNSAARALVAIGGDASRAALRKALPEAPAHARVAIIDAIGVLGDRASSAALLPYIKSDDDRTRRAALWALASIGNTSTVGALPDPKQSGSWHERAERAALALEFASHQPQAALMFRNVMKSQSGPEFAHVQAAALHGLVEALGPEAIDDVISALTSNNPEIRAAAMSIAVALSGTGATRAYVDQLEHASPAARAAVLAVLTRRGDEAALGGAIRALNDEDKAVRLAAVIATVTLGKEKAIDPLIAFLHGPVGSAHAIDQDELQAAQAALVQLPGDSVSEIIAGAIGEAPPHVRVALLGVLADRGAAPQRSEGAGILDTVFAATAHPDEAVRIAGLSAVGALAGAEAAPKLLELLISRPPRGADATEMSKPQRDALELALAAVSSRTEDSAKRAALVLAAKPTSEIDSCSRLRVLGLIGGADALGAVRAAISDSRAQVREAAFRSLSDWRDPDGAIGLLVIARGVEEVKYHVLTMRAYARLVSLDSTLSAKETLSMYAAGLACARRSEEKKLMLSKLGEVHDSQTLATLKPYLSDETLGAEAASAMISVADGLLPAGWAGARAALEKVLSVTTVESVRRRALAVMDRVGDYEGYILDWVVAGPYRQKDKPGNEVLDIAFPPESSGKSESSQVDWQPQPVTDDPERFWYVDLKESIGGGHTAAYLRTSVYSPKAQQALLEIGSDDGVKAWLNGELIHTNNALRGCSPGDDKVEVSLNESWNRLLLKVSNNSGGFGACVRLVGSDGSRLEGIYVKAQP